MERLQNLVDRAEATYCRRYIEGEHATKLADCRAELHCILEELECHQVPLDAAAVVRGTAGYVRGLSQCLLHGFDCLEARTLLTSAAKLAPRMPGPWNCLGHCYWTAGELETALHCFGQGLQACPNKEGLRQRSILRRHTATVQVHVSTLDPVLLSPLQPIIAPQRREGRGIHVLWPAGQG